MSTRERRMHTRITGHTSPERSEIDAHMEPDVGTPGQFEGPMDGRLSGFSLDGDERVLARRSIHPHPSHARPMPIGMPRIAAADGNGRSQGRSIAELLRRLSVESGDLVRQEVALAKAEMREKMVVFGRGMAFMGVGAGLLFCALLTGLWALNVGVTALLVRFMALDVAVWLSPLILTLVLGLVGWMTILSAKARMADEGVSMRRTAETLREDKRWARARMQEVKEEVTHGR